jgi:hypothetical protein
VICSSDTSQNPQLGLPMTQSTSRWARCLASSALLNPPPPVRRCPSGVSILKDHVGQMQPVTITLSGYLGCCALKISVIPASCDLTS